MSPLEAIVALNALPNIGPIRIRRLIDACGDASTVLQTPEQQLLAIDGIGALCARTIRDWQDHCDPADEIEEAQRRGISLVTREHEDYPQSLLHAYDAPVLLYVWGTLDARDRHAIAIVGSRRTSHYGIQATRKFSYPLARNGHTILSGLARGIDTAAHEAAVAAGGRTIAVIGSGLARLYPPENLGLAERIANGHGAVISEFPLNTPPGKQTFPMRNRIVAAWAKAILVTECPAWSGAIITANLASEYGKRVFAVPGPIDRPGSAGCHQLIRDGATLVTDTNEMLDDLGELSLHLTPSTQPTNIVLSETESLIHAALQQDDASVDELVERTALSAAIVSRDLLKLALRGLIQPLAGGRYSMP